MKRSTVLTEKNRGTWATVFAGLILLPVILSILRPLWAAEPEVFLEPADARWENCLRDKEYMRFYHMDLLKEARADVIRAGMKGGITLAGCGDCHQNREAFCDRCHEKASVSLDCWGCHYYLTDDELQELEEHGGGGA
jgi:hypothetical protein